MGTNYYHYNQHPCGHCGRPFKPRHIGKSSGGWCFALHVYPDEQIHDLEDWRRRWRNGYIQDEYGKRLSADEILKVITARERHAANTWTAREYASNYAEPGPNGLVRHRLCSESWCVAHGAGTWDLIVGDGDRW